MKTLFTLALILTASVSAQTKKSTRKTTDTSTVTTTTTARQALPAAVIPKGAVEGADGNFHFTDPQGKKWTYRNTPFGVSKVEDKDPGTPAPPQQDTLTTATDAGDSVNFSKPSPFGTVKWTKKKTEMDANETSVWNSQKKQ